MEIQILTSGGLLASSFEKFVDSNTSYIQNFDEINQENLLLYLTDNFDMEEEKLLFDYCRRNNVSYLRANLLGKSGYIGPFYKNGSPSIVDFVSRMKINSPEHRLLLREKVYQAMEDMDTSEEKTIFLQLITHKIESLIELFTFDYENVEGRIWIISSDPLNITEHQITKDINNQDYQVTFNESALFDKEMIKQSPDSYRTKNTFDLDSIRKKYSDSIFGVFKHTYISTQSSWVPMVGSESNLEAEHHNNAYGRAFDYKKAELSALLEGLERHYNSTNHQGRKYIYGSYNQLKKDAIHPSKFGLHTEKERMHLNFEYTEYHDDLEFNWVWSWSVRYSRYVLIPEQLIYYYDDTLKKKEKRFVYDSSNGAALGNNIEEGLLYGLFELIERDNFFVSFYNQLSLVEVDIHKSGLDDIVSLTEYLKSENYSIHFFDMSMELKIPSIWGVMINHSDGAIVKTYNAAGAHFNPEDALRSALIECVTSVPVYEEIYTSEALQSRRREIVNNPEKLTEFEDHVLYYSHELSLKKLDFLFNEKREIKSLQEIYPEWYCNQLYKNKTLNEDIMQLLDRVFNYYDDIYLTDLSGEELKEVGLSCVKVCVPGMQPVTFGEQHKRILLDRVLKAPVISGRLEVEQEIDLLNKEPHPFP